MINEQRLVDLFLSYVKISSPTKQEGRFAAHLCKALEEMGLEVSIDDAGEKVGSDTGNVIARLKGNMPGETILFSSHMDTVSPSIDVKPVIRDGVIYSDGTTVLGGDDKAGIAAIMEAVKTIIDNNLPHADIEIVFSIFEEGGLHGAKNLDISMLKAKQVFVLDSSGEPGQIIVKGPAQDKLEFSIHGKPAHAGVVPEEGISAIMVASHAISHMNLLRIDSETTANIGRIEGGSVTNIVPAETTVIAEARSLNNDKLKIQSDHMVACFSDAANKFGATVESKVTRMYSAFSIDENSDIVIKAKTACETIGLTASTIATGGGSDTNIYNARGMMAINLGIGEKKAHTLEEHLHIKDLIATSKLVLELVKLSVTK
ncbi:M20/M25/M40 family metallo-hydrolase [Fusibacter bizertensis]